MKAMKTPAAKAKGMKPNTNTMKVMKTPAAKAKGMEPKTEAKHMKPEIETDIIIDGAIRLTTPYVSSRDPSMSPLANSYVSA